MLPILPFEKITKKAGVKRISKQALEELRDIMEEHAFEIAEKSVKISFHANRRTVMENDVKFVVEK